MSEKLTEIVKLVQQSGKLSDEEKSVIIKSLKDADKELAVSTFKIERLEKVKHTTTVLLEQTIEELDAKRKSVEKQKRELEIEGALEKVRSRSLAMHQSRELEDVVSSLFDRLIELGLRFDGALIFLFDKGKKNIRLWIATTHLSSSVSIELPYDKEMADNEIINDLWQAVQSGKHIFNKTYSGQSKNDYFRYVVRYNESKVPEPVRRLQLEREKWTVCLAAEKNLLLGFDTWSEHNIIDEDFQILKRFAIVFEQAYTRFLDLEKAEAQARESQIQLALERVRARTMAMQKSEELKSAAALLFQQVKELGAPAYSCGYNIWEKDEKEFTSWMSTQDGSEINAVYNIPLTEDANFIRYVESKQRGESFFVLELRGERMQEHYEYLKTIPAFKAYFEYATSVGFIPPETQIHHIANFSKGNLLFITLEPCPEYHDVFKRFAAVFEQTYTRFLDLQNAEAQGQESRIQLALERVRARTMAMHNSNELGEVAVLLFEQVKSLGIETYASGFNIWDEEHNKVISWMSNPTGSINPPFEMPIQSYEQHRRIFDAWKKHKAFFEDDIKGEDLVKHYGFLRSFHLLNEAFNKSEAAGIKTPDRQVHNIAMFSRGYLLFITTEPQSRFHEIFIRFAKVFEQTYTRFLDLKKAEAQAREAKIEAALEKVRSRSLVMLSSNELPAIARTMFDQLRNLGLELEDGLIVMVFKEGSHDQLQWPVLEGVETNKMFLIPELDDPIIKKVYEARDKGIKFIEGHFDKAAKDAFLDKVFSITDYREIPIEFQQRNYAGKYYHYSFALEKYTGILMQSYNRESYPPEYNDILRRFARVFEQAYVRFLDLQKAEAQAREAQIEAGLERVRSRAMGMQSSEELKALIGTVFSELTKLDLVLTRCVIWVFDSTTNGANWWMANSEDPFNPMSIFVKYHEHPAYLTFLKEWRSQSLRVVYDLKGQDKIEWDRILFNETELRNLPDAIKDGMRAPDRVLLTASFNNSGALNVASLEPLSDEHFDILLRFAKVFDLTYTRFLDLQKAESQAREAKIQLALERVRARTMAMQHSDELADVAYILFQQFKQLGEDPIQITIGIINEEANTIEFRITGGKGSGSKIEESFIASIEEPTLMNKVFRAWKLNKKSEVIRLQGKELVDWVTYRNSINGKYAYETKVEMDDRRYVTAGFFSKGLLSISTTEVLSEESIQILERFASVFDLTYTRFLDLKQAEESARESQIEAALERVRGKAMAMHNSNDLSVTASMVFTELRKLGITPIRCGVGLLNEESRKAQLYSATSSVEGDGLSLVGWVLLEGHPVLEKIYDSWLMREDYYPELGGQQLRSYYELLLAGLSVKVPDWEDGQKQHGHFFSFSIGCLYAWSISPYNESEIRILKRFASIIDLTFRRYIELQKSEANAKEAVKQAALDRVRAEIASMRTVADLEKITPLIWNELTILGIPFIRCGVFIMDEREQSIHTFLSTPNGEAIAAFHIPFNTPGNMELVLKHWKERKAFVDQWDEREFNEFAETLVKQRALSSSEQYLQTIPHGGFHLHFLPFLQGMLYVGNSSRLNEDQLELIQCLAEAFSTAYARYEDFNKLEIAKRQVDSTLDELRSTQTQLVHAEKMASLGELTAGIAHEIQNPLNFVNNFSEVSSELLEEIKLELDRGDVNEARAIVEDVRQNLQKIAHHGKRADGIVKSMLQHSRKGSGQKDLVDINSLVDEYLRMSFHGFRAKDKSFNAILETHYDPEVKTASIVGQDIGRVLLNLFNNAFYAVNERKKEVQNGYEPIVQVTTSKLNGTIEIKVKDNGTGIPGKVLEKIYQPFFTTKPTGEGTGLGLSLSYDIITKGHGGDMKVETVEGKGSEFVIQLPNLSSL